MTLRVGVVGTGVMGADHVRTLTTRVSGAVVTAVTDLDAGRAASVAREAGAGTRVTASGLELITADDVDAVIIASDDASHASLTLAAVAAGKPVLVEKPLAPTVAECRRVVDAERDVVGDGPALVHVGFMRRFDPAHVELRRAVQGGRIGRALVAHAVHRNTRTAPGGTSETTVTSSAIHELDSLPWVLGSALSEVSWHAPSAPGSLPGRADPQVLLVRTADGALCTVELFVNAGYGYDVRLEVAGEGGTLALADSSLLVRNAELGRALDYPADWRPRFAEAYRAELQAWVDAIVTGRPAPDLACAADGLRAAQAADAVIASMHAGGAPVQVPPAPPRPLA
ncbi:Gfo/Idh/MocA family oxidoreductase [Georgenia sp. MJ206]|uniref:Gfo/Idh/MocA family protein n=1 Tax=Georgenia wangjunii TaxID=3117730 RepID=UPI002F261239